MEYNEGFVLGLVQNDSAPPSVATPPVVFSSSDTSVILLKGSLLTPLKAGTATIEAYEHTLGGRLLARRVMTVHPQRLLYTGVSGLGLYTTGSGSVRLTGTTDPAYATWVASDPSIIALGGPGIALASHQTYANFYAAGMGTGAVTVTLDRDTSIKTVVNIGVIRPDIGRIDVSPANVTIRGMGDSAQVTVRMFSVSNVLILDRLPTLTNARPSVARIVDHRGSPTLGYMTFTIFPAAAGVDTVYLESTPQRTALPIVVHVAGPDTVVAFPRRDNVFPVLANDLGSARISSISSVRHGTATIASDGQSISYVPASGYFGPDTLSYVTSVAGGSADSGLVAIAVTPGPYSFTPIDIASGTVDAVALNDSDVVAATLSYGAGVGAVVRWRKGIASILQTNSGNGVAMRMNSAGDIVGSDGGVPVLWPGSGAGPITIPAPAGARVFGINDAGHIGVHLAAGLDIIRRRDGADTVRSACSDPVDITNGDLMLLNGCVTFSPSYPNWSVFPLSSTGGYSESSRTTFAVAINDSGSVIGAGAGLTDGTRLYLWRRGGPTTSFSLETDLHAWTTFALNDLNWALMQWNRTGETDFALYIAGAYPRISRILAATPGAWSIDKVVAINNRGSILAYGTNPATGVRGPVLLVPATPGPGHP